VVINPPPQPQPEVIVDLVSDEEKWPMVAQPLSIENGGFF
jgi:hypothetical protein